MTKQQQLNQLHTQRLDHEAALQAKDYIGHKAFDAILAELLKPSTTIAKLQQVARDVMAEYPDYLDQHQAGRDGINECQDAIESIEAEPDDEPQEQPDNE